MKNLLKMMKLGDIIIIGLLVILSFLPLAIFSKEAGVTGVDDGTYLVVSVDGEVLHKMELTDDYTRESYRYENEAGHMNLIVRDGDQAYMKDGNCRDSLCVQHGTISQVGETIVCLPHRLLVEIVSESPAMDSEIDIYN